MGQIGWADAFVGLAHAALAIGAEGADATSRVDVLVHLEAPGPDAADVGRWRAEVHDGPPLPPSLRRLLTCDADVAPVWWRDGRAVQFGRTRRDVPLRVRRIVQHRDHHTCQVPGCTSTLWLQVHHIVHWEDGGVTDTVNLICLCPTHHRMHHAGLLAITGDADHPASMTFTDATGRDLRPSRPEPPPPGAAPPTTPYDGPTGERLRAHDVHFSRLTADHWRHRPADASP